MDGALGKDGAFVLVQVTGDFRVVAGCDDVVLEDVTELEVATVDKRQELSGAWMDVRRVDAAWVEESNRGGNTETS